MHCSRTSVLLTSLLAIGLVMSACKKDQVGGVPPTSVDISININLPAYADLAVPGGWLYLTGGSQGIIVYRVNNDEFVAMDRHCPYQPQNSCKVVVDDTQVIARDTACCGSAYLIIDGSVSQGPSSFGLKRYNTLFNGTTLRIYN
jgi:nitrite reductase/ring-hydroxylating ferredoxin subunit